MYSIVVFLPILLLCFIYLNNACDIIVHVKSKTSTKFLAQVIAPNDKKSNKFIIFLFV